MEAIHTPEVAASIGRFRRTVYEIDGIETVVLEIGEGRPFVFLHGAGTFPGFAFAEGLQADARVIIPYHPGFGESADDRRITHISGYTRHYAALFARMELSDFDLAGFSLGGWIAAEYAATVGTGLRRLLLAAPGGLVVPSHPAPDLSALTPDVLPAFLTHDPSIAASFFPKEAGPEFWNALGRELLSLLRLLTVDPQGDPELAGRIGSIAVPTLLLWGDRDRIRPNEQGQEWLARLPDGRLEVLGECGHLLFEEQPRATELLRTFLVP